MIRSLGTFFFCAIVLFSALPVLAAEVYLDVDAVPYDRRDTFYIPVRIDVRDECTNAATVVIAYDPRELSVREIVTSRSIFTLWPQSPSIDRDAQGNELGTVRFSGGVPGGYCGRVEGDPGLTNILADLVVTGAPAAQTVGGLSTTTLLVSPETTLYRHDGTGTTLDTTLLGAELSLTIVEGAQPVDYWQGDVHADRTAPELFEITLVEGPSLGHTRDYIVFSTVDKQSGISHYEVLETDPDRFGLLKWFPREAHWVRAESPYVLRDQELMSRIMVRAVDRNGNERVVTYEPSISLVREFVRPSTLALLFGGVLISGAALVVVWYVIRRLWRGLVLLTRKEKIPQGLDQKTQVDTQDESHTV
ncbi:MAG: hypothetical protein KBD21_03120 [Candidatus Pacebacteria bacterium]|nr:hypothetical protein [Candidatus Paceibacterota bacterium]